MFQFKPKVPVGCRLPYQRLSHPCMMHLHQIKIAKILKIINQKSLSTSLDINDTRKTRNDKSSELKKKWIFPTSACTEPTFCTHQYDYMWVLLQNQICFERGFRWVCGSDISLNNVLSSGKLGGGVNELMLHRHLVASSS